MGTELPLRDRILDATVDVVRRHGAEKTNVVDVAEVLGMSPGNIYRCFDSKKRLLEAVAVRWLDELTAPMESLAADSARPAGKRLERWFHTLRKAKRRKLVDEPELFRVYLDVIADARKTAEEHVKHLLGQIERIIADGVADREFARTTDPKAAAKAFLHATSAFHHPALVVRQPAPTEAEAKALIRLLLAGLRAG